MGLPLRWLPGGRAFECAGRGGPRRWRARGHSAARGALVWLCLALCFWPSRISNLGAPRGRGEASGDSSRDAELICSYRAGREKLQVRDTPGEARDTRPARSAGRGEIWRFSVQTGQNLDLREVSRDDGRRRGLGYSMSEVPGRIRVIHGSTFDDNRPSKRVPGCENASNQFH